MGCYKPFARLVNHRQQWRYHSLRLGRVLDWLRLLDFEPVSIEHGFYRPPLGRRSFLERLGWMERLGQSLKLSGGAYYCVVARKEIAAMTPIRPVWHNMNPIAGLTAAKRSSSVLTQSAARSVTMPVPTAPESSPTRKHSV